MPPQFAAHLLLARPRGKILGFKKFDKVRYLGSTYFIKGRMSTGYSIGMNILGSTLIGSGY